jgi:hypothetical protein
MTNPLRADRREKGNCFRAPRSDARGPFSRREKEKNREEETTAHRPFLASRVGGRNAVSHHHGSLLRRVSFLV